MVNDLFHSARRSIEYEARSAPALEFTFQSLSAQGGASGLAAMSLSQPCTIHQADGNAYL